MSATGGKRVVLIEDHLDLKAGTEGVVVHWYSGFVDYCAVEFCGRPWIAVPNKKLTEVAAEAGQIREGMTMKSACDALHAHDPVNHPKHYTGHPSGIECIQITEHMGFCLGNAVKYIWRADLKNDAIEDLKKAAWYLDREIKRREKK